MEELMQDGLTLTLTCLSRRYIVRQVQLGLKSPKNALAIAQGGLDYWCVCAHPPIHAHIVLPSPPKITATICAKTNPLLPHHATTRHDSYKNFEFIRDGQTYKLGEALDKFTTHSYETGVIKGSGALPKFGPVVKVID